MPHDINKFMMNGENKTALIDLTFQCIRENKEIVIQMLQTQMVVLSGDDKCFTIFCANVCQNNLRSNQEEADSKVLLHTIHILQESESFVLLRSPSGDTDSTVLALALIPRLQRKNLL